MRRIALRASGVAALAVIGACREPTEIEVEISSDVCAKVRGDGVTIAVADSAEALRPRAASARQVACTDTTGVVGSIVLVPSGDKGARVAIEVALHLTNDADCGVNGEKCIVARRVLRYARHTRLVLPIALREVCAGVPCPIEQTCAEGTCVSAELLDPDTCVLAGTCADGSGSGPNGGGPGDGAVDAREGDASTADVAASGDGGCPVVPGAQPESVEVDCPVQPCLIAGHVCCTGPTAPLGACVKPGLGCAVKPCDEDGDCGSNIACCAYVNHAVGVATYVCSTTGLSCGPGQVHVCKTSCACGTTELPCRYSPTCQIATCGGGCPQ
jgi:hypothetical protein